MRILYTLFFLFVTLQTFAQGTVKYEYDANNRLTQVTYSNGVIVSYTYDALGNRLSKKVTGAAPIKKGDVNGDGEINTKDIVDLVSYMMGNTTLSLSAADVNGDGKVDITDVLMVSNAIMNK